MYLSHAGKLWSCLRVSRLVVSFKFHWRTWVVGLISWSSQTKIPRPNLAGKHIQRIMNRGVERATSFFPVHMIVHTTCLHTTNDEKDIKSSEFWDSLICKRTHSPVNERRDVKSTSRLCGPAGDHTSRNQTKETWREKWFFDRKVNENLELQREKSGARHFLLMYGGANI